MPLIRFPNFIGSSYELRSLNVECQRCINMYPELDEMGTEKDQGVAYLIGTPGLRLLTALPDAGPYRCAYVAQNNCLYVVSNNKLYGITRQFTTVSIGTLASTVGPVSMSDNGSQAFLVDGANGYYFDLTDINNDPGAATNFTQTSDSNWQGSTLVYCADGMFVFNVPNTFKWYVSNPLSVNINPIGLASRETPDNIVGFVWDKRNLWLFGQKSTELWYDAGQGVGGTTGNPFQVVQGGYLEVGCAAAFSIVQLGNSIVWLGQDPRGNGVVYQSNGSAPQRISTHAVELAIQSYGDLSTAVAWTYQQDGHDFYLINFDNADTTWVFDLNSQMWHERAYTTEGINNPNLLARHRAQVHAFCYNTHVVGDYQNGNLYALDPVYYSDNGNPITRRRATPHISDNMNRVFFHKFQLDFQPGVGIDGSGQGTDPQAMLQYSDDGGHTWSNEIWTSLGSIGETTYRAIWRRLGQGRNRVFRVTVTDPVEVIMIGAELDAESGQS